jgi:hypothetical protein
MGIGSFFRKVGRKILGGAKVLRNVVGSAYDRMKKIPGLGQFVQTVVEKVPITPGGKTIADLAHNASTGLDMVDKASNGDYKGALSSSQSLKLKTGGIVSMKPMKPPGPFPSPNRTTPGWRDKLRSLDPSKFGMNPPRNHNWGPQYI